MQPSLAGRDVSDGGGDYSSCQRISSPLDISRIINHFEKRLGWPGGKKRDVQFPGRRNYLIFWRRGSESNRRTRICSPLHDHSATPPCTSTHAAPIRASVGPNHQLRGSRSRRLPMGKSGAGNESRTRDLNLGKVALYQLSYSRGGIADYSYAIDRVKTASFIATAALPEDAREPGAATPSAGIAASNRSSEWRRGR